MDQACPECGAAWVNETTCQDCFHQMLFWENEYPGYGEVHHLLVLCYHLQHPSLYSAEGLVEARRLLTAFVAEGATPEEVRRQNRAKVSSDKRTWKIKATAVSQGSYRQPINWPLTAVDVVNNGPDHYCATVRQWAQSIHELLG
jgi:hypothetical protein